MLMQSAFSMPQWRMGPASSDQAAATTTPTSTVVGEGLLGVRVDALSEQGSASQAGVLSGYLLPFEIVSMHLLVVLIGAAYLARAKRRTIVRQAEA